MNSVERFCDRAMLLERGRMLEIGAPDEITQHYNEVNFGAAPARPRLAAETAQPRRRDLLEPWCENADGERIVAAAQGERCAICIEVEFRDDSEELVFARHVQQRGRGTSSSSPTSGRQPIAGPFAEGERIVVRLSFDNWLAPEPLHAHPDGRERSDPELPACSTSARMSHR